MASAEQDDIKVPETAERRSVIERTAGFIATHGEDYKEKLLSLPQHEQFSFVQEGDEYYPYYKRHLDSLRSKQKKEKEGLQAMEEADAAADERAKKEEEERKAKADERKTLLKRLLSGARESAGRQEPTQVKPPPKPAFIHTIPYDVTAADLDVMKLAAVFVARNGPQFHVGLMHREGRNPQFDFLKQTHHHNTFFNALVNAYTRVLLPPKDVAERLRSEAVAFGSEDARAMQRMRIQSAQQQQPANGEANGADGADGEAANGAAEEKSDAAEADSVVPQRVRKRRLRRRLMDRVVERVQWERLQLEKARAKDSQDAEDRAVRSQIDWHDFVIVETITFEDDDAAAVPESGRANAAAQAQADKAESSDEDMEDEMDMETDEMDLDESEIKVRKDYVPVYARKAQPTAAAGATQKCPICAQEIAVDELEDHMRIELLDPRFAAEKKAMLEKQGNSSLASGEDINQALKGLAARRTDIFGEDEELGIGVTKDGRQMPSKPDAAIWDGHASSIEKTTSAALASLSIQEQLEAIRQKQAEEAKNRVQFPAPAPPQPQPTQQMPQRQAPPPAAAPTPSPGAPPSQQGGLLPRPQFPPGHPLAQPQQQPMFPPPQAGNAGAGGGVGGPGGAPSQEPAAVSQPSAGEKRKEPPAEEPPPKKQMTAADLLKPEDEWLKEHGGPVTFTINVAEQSNKHGWKLDGQSVEVTFDMTATVGDLKKKMADETGVPMNKQKMRTEELPVLKDKSSLAAYNFAPDTVVSMSMKERGGRKR